MNDKKKELYNAILDKQTHYYNAKEAFGEEYFLTRNYFREMVGLQEAFKIVFGISHIDFFIDNVEELTV